jgi:hypothetical protein
MGIFDFLTPKTDGFAYDPMRLPAGADPENDPVVGYDELGQKIRRSRFDGTQYLFEMEAPKTQSVVKGAYREATADPLGFTGDLLSNAVQSAWDAISVPRRAMEGQPLTYGDIAGLTGMVTLGAGAGTAPAGALRMGAAREGRAPVTFDDAERAMREAQGIRAYQGSPHNFAAERLVRMPDGSTQYIVGRPDVLPDVPAGAEVLQDFPLGRMRMDKLGTGEGAQAFGHGLYAAENEGIARGYRDNLSGRNQGTPFVSDDVRALLDAAGGDFEKAASDARSYLRDYGDQMSSDQVRDVKEAIRLLNAQKQSWGKVYELNINADPNTFLDWDKPLSEQPQTVRDALGPRIDELRKAGAGIAQDPIGESLWRIAYPQGGFDVTDFSRSIPEQASERLLNAGIPGIKYLDQGSRYTPSNLPNNPISNEARVFLDQANGDAEMALRLFNGSNPAERFATTERDEVRKVIEAAGRTATRNFVVFDENLISIVRKYGIAGAAVMLGTSADQISQTLNENMTQEELNNLVSGA